MVCSDLEITGDHHSGRKAFIKNILKLGNLELQSSRYRVRVKKSSSNDITTPFYDVTTRICNSLK